MSSAAVRAWLVSTLAPLGLPVYDQPLVVLPKADYLAITRFPRRQEPLSFGNAGALVANTYTPSLLVVLVNPSADASPQHVLDGYVETACDLIRQAATPAAISDPVTQEISELMLVGSIGLDPAPSNTLAATVIVPTLTEYATEAA